MTSEQREKYKKDKQIIYAVANNTFNRNIDRYKKLLV